MSIYLILVLKCPFIWYWSLNFILNKYRYIFFILVLKCSHIFIWSSIVNIYYHIFCCSSLPMCLLIVCILSCACKRWGISAAHCFCIQRNEYGEFKNDSISEICSWNPIYGVSGKRHQYQFLLFCYGTITAIFGENWILKGQCHAIVPLLFLSCGLWTSYSYAKIFLNILEF